ncbi:MAG TPA: hypothetical protein VI489_02120 [Candidatus Brocadiaceae bacterium]
MIPESQKQHNDLIDFLSDACQRVEEIELPDGTKEKQLVTDPEIAWWKTLLVNSPTFGRFAFELKNFEGLAAQCHNNMSKPRAVVMTQQIMAIGASFRRSMDAKSSESLRDKLNTQSTLIDKLNRTKSERAITLKGEMKKSFMDGMLGREGQRETEED